MVDGHFKTIRPELQQPTSVLQTKFAVPDLDEEIGSSIPETQKAVLPSSVGDASEAVAPPPNEQDFMFSTPATDGRTVGE